MGSDRHQILLTCQAAGSQSELQRFHLNKKRPRASPSRVVQMVRSDTTLLSDHGMTPPA